MTIEVIRNAESVVRSCGFATSKAKIGFMKEKSRHPTAMTGKMTAVTKLSIKDSSTMITK